MTELEKACIYYRAKHGLTQAKMAKLCGISRNLIIQIEQGKSVSKLTEAKVKLRVDDDMKGA